MIKIDKQRLDKAEEQNLGFIDMMMAYENADIPACPFCSSRNTARVCVGLVSMSMLLAASTTKVHLRANGKPGEYFCNCCKKYY